MNMYKKLKGESKIRTILTKLTSNKITIKQSLLCILFVLSLNFGFVYKQVSTEIDSEEYQKAQINRSYVSKTAKTPTELKPIENAISVFCPDLERSKISYYASIVYKESKNYGYDWRLIIAMMKAESNFDKQAKSYKGAVGLMQLMPNTAEWISPKLKVQYNGASSLHNPEYNVKLGVHYLSMMEDKFGDLDKAIVAYNKGPRKLKDDLDQGLETNSNFLEKVKAYYLDIKSFTTEYPA